MNTNHQDPHHHDRLEEDAYKHLESLVLGGHGERAIDAYERELAETGNFDRAEAAYYHEFKKH